MKGNPVIATAVALAAIAMATRVTMPAHAAPTGGDTAAERTNAAVAAAARKPTQTAAALPDIGTRMPDGTVYAGLSMDTGKPSFVAPAGGKMPDGTIYAGISPDTGKGLYTTSVDAPGVYTWSQAIEYCRTLSESGHQDWRVPTMGELAVQFVNRADIGGFNETGQMENATGYYWSSWQVSDGEAWAQRFNDGFHEHPGKDINSLLRCVR